MTREGSLLTVLSGKIGKYLSFGAMEQITRAILERKWEEKEKYAFYARYREPAIALIVATGVLKNDPVSGKLAKQLLDGVNKQGYMDINQRYWMGAYCARRILQGHVFYRQTGQSYREAGGIA